MGLDIGHRLIRVAVVHHKQNSKRVLYALEQDNIPEGIIVDNEIKNIPVLTDKVHDLLSRAMPGGISGDFVISVNWTSGILCDRILVKPVPKVPENECVLQAAMARSPFDDAGNVLDYSIMERRDEGLEAMIVAAKKDSLTSWVNLFQALNLKISAIDVDAFALANAYAAEIQSSTKSQIDDEDDSVLLLNLGYSKSYAAMLYGGRFSTARSILGGSIKELQEQMAAPLGISVEQCADVLRGIPIKGASVEESKLKSALEVTFEEIAMKVDTALRYFTSSDNYKKPSKLLLAGGGAGIAGLSAFLVDRLTLGLVKLDPFKSVQVDHRMGSVNLGAAANSYAVAMGLALRRF